MPKQVQEHTSGSPSEKSVASGSVDGPAPPINRLQTALIRLAREVFRYLRARGHDDKIAAALFLLLDTLRPRSRYRTLKKLRRDDQRQAQRAAALRTLGLNP